eukprot:4658691-Pleurochrysis_carterae.AAC.1
MQARALRGGGAQTFDATGRARQKQRGDVLRRFGGGNPSGSEAAVNVVVQAVGHGGRDRQNASQGYDG